jgi:hypothetical protein
MIAPSGDINNSDLQPGEGQVEHRSGGQAPLSC